MYLQIKNRPGDVYVLDSDRILVYGHRGIALTLSSKNLDVVLETMETPKSQKDCDRRGVRYTLSFRREKFIFDITRGPQLEVDAHEFITKLECANA